ncbi:MAG: S46 family peptidase [Flavobacteriales bacterium]|jgi:hypothetical protein
MKLRFLAALLLIAHCSLAKEGMWIPSLLNVVYSDMQSQGLQLTAEDLYDANGSSLKDAIVLFGGGCTGEIVSNDGLLFTNHHCGFDYIQFHSSLKNDYLKDGFWAKSRADELRCDGLSVVFVVRMDDVTEAMRKGITSTMSPAEVDAILQKNKKALEEQYKKENPALGLQLKSFNYGNQCLAILTKTYNDVRLVGAPPSEIGKFGGDTDNWVWPRHTGDFSVFRIYADAKNEPAKYSASNVPFKPAHHLPINIGGVKEGDFSMVYGFPGRTEHLLTSYAVEFITNKLNPMRIDMRDQTIAVLEGRMRASDEIRIKYAAKQSDVANAWKKWKGQQIGLTNFRALEQKRKFEEDYRAQCAKPEFRSYEAVLSNLESLYARANSLNFEAQRFVEYMYYGPELFNFSYRFHDLVANFDTLKAQGKLTSTIEDLKLGARAFYKDFDLATEMAIYGRLEPLYDGKYAVRGVADKIEKVNEEAYRNFYLKSVFADSTILFKLLDNPGKGMLKKMERDYFYSHAAVMFDDYNARIRPELVDLNKQIDFWMQKYTEGMMKMFPGNYWADANSTLRISYGKVDGSFPRDGEHYTPHTTADGILQKYYTGHPDFAISPKLKSLLEARNYGDYGSGGELNVCYTGSNHTTGGNSGSPALNAKGELTGINFDRSWESTMSDIMYNPEICRNIMVDIRYVLWVIDVYADADYLLKEMTLVK